MAANKKTITNKNIPTGSKQPDGSLAEKYFAEYAATHQDPVNKVIHYICVPLLIFSLFGLVWAIPFPQLQFLGEYKGYLNWASFLIAAAIYFYLKLSPLISYIVLFILLGFSYLIIELLAWQLTGGPAMWLFCIAIFIPSLSAMVIGNAREVNFSQKQRNVISLIVGPAYLLHLILKKLSVKH